MDLTPSRRRMELISASSLDQPFFSASMSPMPETVSRPVFSSKDQTRASPQRPRSCSSMCQPMIGRPCHSVQPEAYQPISWSTAAKIRSSSLHSRNTASPTSAGSAPEMKTVARLEQPAKARLPRAARPPGSSISLRLTQPINASLPISETLSGMEISSSLNAPAKAAGQIAWTASGISKLVSRLPAGQAIRRVPSAL